MDKNAIKRYAIWARKELIVRVAQKAQQYGISNDNLIDANADNINGKVLSYSEKKQRQALIKKVNINGFEQVIEEVAYTWFNRFIALRYMEVNGLIPSKVRVFTDESDCFKPQIIDEAIHLSLEGLDLEKIYEFKEANNQDELYKYLIITQCNALYKVLPGLFQRIEDYTELLFPDNILREGSIIDQMIINIPETEWKDTVQIIGWLYQYYNTEKKDEVFSALKNNVKITKENIPAATQLFTPEWIVRYMVENSLGRFWVESHPDETIKGNWEYFLEDDEQTYEVTLKLSDIRKEYADIKPENIKCIDPCMGSGHILAYMFDVLMQIYESYGYTTVEAVSSIIQNNIHGLDIDERATQLAYFTVMMKASQYDKRFLKRGIQPNVYAIRESNGINSYVIDYFCGDDSKIRSDINKLMLELKDAKEYGSILNISTVNFEAIEKRIIEIEEDVNIAKFETLSELVPMLKAARNMAQKYEIVVTNPPYMGGSGMSPKLTDFVKKNYSDSKSDLFACFIEKCGQMSKCYYAMITQHSWMFLASYENLRKKLQNHTTVSMAHLGARAFDDIAGEVVQTTSFVNYKRCIDSYKGVYVRLISCVGESEKSEAFKSGKHRYGTCQKSYVKIPGQPIAYWVSDGLISAFDHDTLKKHSISPSQNITGNNERFVRKVWELDASKIGLRDGWIFYAKGGGYRKWWGNLDNVVDWTPKAREIYQYGDGKHASQIINKDYWYKKGITWGLIASTNPSFRVMPEGATFDKGGSTIIVDEEMYKIALALLNSKLFVNLASILNPTMNLQVKDICSLPIIVDESVKDEIETIVDENIMLSKKDWDSFETSWEFERHPLI